jgi:hypothetical protein
MMFQLKAHFTFRHVQRPHRVPAAFVICAAAGGPNTQFYVLVSPIHNVLSGV